MRVKIENRTENKMTNTKNEREYAELNADFSNMIFDLAKKNFENHPCVRNAALFITVKQSIANNHSTYAYNIATLIR